MRWFPRRVLGTERRANAIGRKNLVHDNTQANDNIAIVHFNGETHQPINPRHLEGREGQNKVLSKGCVLETQNSIQSSSLPLDVTTFLANLLDGEGDNISFTPTFKHPRIGEVDSINEGCSTSILEHIWYHRQR